jgi:hypothetical protein
MAKVLLGIPSGGSVKSNDDDHDDDHGTRRCARSCRFTHVFLVDADMSFPGDTLSTQALAHIPRPWFALDFDKDGMLSVSDDVWFCQQARRVGIDTWCDPTIKAGHIGEFEF